MWSSILYPDNNHLGTAILVSCDTAVKVDEGVIRKLHGARGLGSSLCAAVCSLTNPRISYLKMRKQDRSNT